MTSAPHQVNSVGIDWALGSCAVILMFSEALVDQAQEAE
jgi:hypothetical protein